VLQLFGLVRLHLSSFSVRLGARRLLVLLLSLVLLLGGVAPRGRLEYLALHGRRLEVLLRSFSCIHWGSRKRRSVLPAREWRSVLFVLYVLIVEHVGASRVEVDLLLVIVSRSVVGCGPLGVPRCVRRAILLQVLLLSLFAQVNRGNSLSGRRLRFLLRSHFLSILGVSLILGILVRELLKVNLVVDVRGHGLGLVQDVNLVVRATRLRLERLLGLLELHLQAVDLLGTSLVLVAVLSDQVIKLAQLFLLDLQGWLLLLFVS